MIWWIGAALAGPPCPGEPEAITLVVHPLITASSQEAVVDTLSGLQFVPAASATPNVRTEDPDAYLAGRVKAHVDEGGWRGTGGRDLLEWVDANAPAYATAAPQTCGPDRVLLLAPTGDQNCLRYVDLGGDGTPLMRTECFAADAGPSAYRKAARAVFPDAQLPTYYVTVSQTVPWLDTPTHQTVDCRPPSRSCTQEVFALDQHPVELSVAGSEESTAMIAEWRVVGCEDPDGKTLENEEDPGTDGPPERVLWTSPKAQGSFALRDVDLAKGKVCVEVTPDAVSSRKLTIQLNLNAPEQLTAATNPDSKWPQSIYWIGDDLASTWNRSGLLDRNWGAKCLGFHDDEQEEAPVTLAIPSTPKDTGHGERQNSRVRYVLERAPDGKRGQVECADIAVVHRDGTRSPPLACTTSNKAPHLSFEVSDQQTADVHLHVQMPGSYTFSAVRLQDAGPPSAEQSIEVFAVYSRMSLYESGWETSLGGGLQFHETATSVVGNAACGPVPVRAEVGAGFVFNEGYFGSFGPADRLILQGGVSVNGLDLWASRQMYGVLGRLTWERDPRPVYVAYAARPELDLGLRITTNTMVWSETASSYVTPWADGQPVVSHMDARLGVRVTTGPAAVRVGTMLVFQPTGTPWKLGGRNPSVGLYLEGLYVGANQKPSAWKFPRTTETMAPLGRPPPVDGLEIAMATCPVFGGPDVDTDLDFVARRKQRKELRARRRQRRANDRPWVDAQTQDMDYSTLACPPRAEEEDAAPPADEDKPNEAKEAKEAKEADN